ncbi:hypothetical protein B0J17DRAFT_771212 [Rhizoctonia solani]|nr:hypothetical protein B0J17DRAFT_771212 [Rhizoctonia solani]
MNLWAAVLQYEQGLDLPDQVVNHQSFSEFTKAGTDLSNLAEDIYSSIRGLQGAHSINIVSAVMHHNRLDLNGSIDFLDQMIRGRLDEYQNLRTKLSSFEGGKDEGVVKETGAADLDKLAPAQIED